MNRAKKGGSGLNPSFKKRSSPPEVFLRKGVLDNMQEIYRRTPMLKCDFNKVPSQLY